jgi:hypothetical protein
LATLLDRDGVVVSFVHEFLTSLADVAAAAAVRREVGLEGVVLLQQALDGGHGVTVVLDTKKLLLLTDPGLLLLNACQELLVGEALVQLLATVGGHLLQLRPRLVQKLEALLDLGHTQVGHVHQLLAGLLHRLDGRLVAAELRLQTLVLLLQVLHSGQIATVVVRANKQLLFPENINLKLAPAKSCVLMFNL